jgi:hypothetical protein
VSRAGDRPCRRHLHDHICFDPDARHNGSLPGRRQLRSVGVAAHTARVTARARITSTMRWNFYDTRTYTRVVGLILRGAAHTRVLVSCHGKACPFSRRVVSVKRRTRCKRKCKARAVRPNAQPVWSTWLGFSGTGGSGSARGSGSRSPAPVGSASTTRSRLVLATYRGFTSAACCRERRVPANAVRPCPGVGAAAGALG